ncbi:hypothetical protein, partial [Bacillus massilinigeriensis]|uniref:hypothetical protein n=1 Tax=Bacillus massilionigeriensis TaxID=1805475 RepID=UPI001C54EA1C
VTHPSAANHREQAPSDSLDLHVLGTPPAFVLSQDQTLRKRVRLALKILKIELTLTYGLFSFQRTIISWYRSEATLLI